jgi:PAS domain S-box-containing protein
MAREPSVGTAATASRALTAELRNKLILAAVAEGIYEWTLASNELYISPRLREMLGFRVGELTSESWNERVHPDDKTLYRTAMVDYFKGRTKRFVCEYRVLDAKGRYRWISDRAKAVRDRDGRVTRYIGAISDVTDRVRTKQALEARNRDLAEALERQTATSEVLKAISRSTFNLQAVLDTLLESAARLCDATIATIRHRDGDTYHLAATYGCTPEWRDHFARYSVKADRGSVFGRTIVERRTVHIPDVLADPDFGRPEAQKLMGFRAALGVPLLREGKVVGVVNLFRPEPRSFTPQQIELVETFADQAVIAIENARLFGEVQARNRDLAEALEQQTATSEILRTISTSPADLQPVLDAVAKNAARLCAADDGHIWQRDSADLQVVASWGGQPSRRRRLTISRQSVVGRAAHDRAPVHVEDLAEAFHTEFPDSRAMKEGGFRTILAVPLLRKGEAIGVIMIRRTEVRPFSDAQIALVTTFADQAVIAIENTRLFRELEARTRDLTESLERQTATTEVLNVISRSTSRLQPVLDTIVETAARLCHAEWAHILRLGDDGQYHLAAANTGDAEFEELLRRTPMTVDRGTVVGRAALERQVVHIPDVLSDLEYRWLEGQQAGKFRTLLGVPLMREGAVIGVVVLLRTMATPFTEKEIELVTTFADQALIAIENVRLFEAEQARTRELTESLARQTATTPVLSVISRSQFAIQQVLDPIVETAGAL